MPSRRQFLSGAGLAVSGLALSSCATGSLRRAAEAAVTSAEDALLRLREGNLRYVASKSLDPNQSEARRLEVAGAQHPFATVLGCVDSRVPPELVFDRGLGDLFVIRTAGQVVDNAVRANIELVVSRLEKSPVLAKKLREGGIKIVGGRYDLDTGSVEITAA
jgi:carbonic anhydrase